MWRVESSDSDLLVYQDTSAVTRTCIALGFFVWMAGVVALVYWLNIGDCHAWTILIIFIAPGLYFLTFARLWRTSTLDGDHVVRGRALSVTILDRLELNRRDGIVISRLWGGLTVLPRDAFQNLLISSQVRREGTRLKSRCLLHLVGPEQSILVACDILEEEIRRRAWEIGAFLRLDVIDDSHEWVDKSAVPIVYRHETLGKPIREQDADLAGDEPALPQAPASSGLDYEWHKEELVVRLLPNGEMKRTDWSFYFLLTGKLVVMASAVLLFSWMLLSPRNPNDPGEFLCPSILLIVSLAWVCRWVWKIWRNGLPKAPEYSELRGLTVTQRGLTLVYQRGERLSETSLPVEKIHDLHVISGKVYVIMDTRDYYLLSLKGDEAKWLRGAIVKALRSSLAGTNSQGITANRKGDIFDIRAEPPAQADPPREHSNSNHNIKPA